MLHLSNGIAMIIELRNAISVTYVTHWVLFILLQKWCWVYLTRPVEGGSSLAPIKPTHVSVQLYTDWSIGIETCGMGDLFPPDDLMFGADLYLDI